MTKPIEWTWDKVTTVAFVLPFLKRHAPPEVLAEARKVWKKQLGYVLNAQLKHRQGGTTTFARAKVDLNVTVNAMLVVMFEIKGEAEKYGICIGVDNSETNIWHVYPLKDCKIREITQVIHKHGVP